MAAVVELLKINETHSQNGHKNERQRARETTAKNIIND